MIKVDNLSVSYGKSLPFVFQGMSFELEKGTILNVLGQNAVGKTTLIRALTRNLQSYEGSIKVKGTEISEYSIKDYAKLVGVVSTSFTTYQNLLVADYLVTGFMNKMDPFAKPNAENVSKAYDKLAELGKPELFNKHIEQLSSGERQLVMIVRVLLQNPEIIIVDEPTANLDVKNQITVLHQIRKLSEQGYTVIVTTHNPGHAYLMGGKTLIMGKGKYSFGDTGAVIVEQTLSEYYGLTVSMKEVDDFKCMVFKNSDSADDIKIIF